MDDLAELHLTGPRPTPQRPLLGTTVLVVEDSRFASEALRLLCLRSGARIRRADCLKSARRHLQTYRPTVAIVDLGLPDGSGLELIKALSTATQRPSVVLGTSGLDRSEAEVKVIEAGGDGFLPKPVESLAAFQQKILHHLPPELQPQGLRGLSCETVRPDTFAMDEDLAEAARMLDDGEVEPQFIGGFLKGVARTGHDEQLMREAEAMLAPAVSPEVRNRIRSLLQSRLGKRAVV